VSKRTQEPAKTQITLFIRRVLSGHPLEGLHRVGISNRRFIMVSLLFVTIIGCFIADFTFSSFGSWWSGHALSASLLANILVFSISFTLYDQLVRVREARNLVQDHDLWNLRSMVDRASETIVRALLIWGDEGAYQHLYLSGEKMITTKDGAEHDLSKGSQRFIYTLECLPIALVDPAFFAIKCDHHRVAHDSLHECLVYDLEKFELYLYEYAQRYRDTGYPDFWEAVDAAEKAQVALDGIAHQLRNIHNPRHPARPSLIIRQYTDYMEARRVVSNCAHTYGRPKTANYAPLEFTR